MTFTNTLVDGDWAGNGDFESKGGNLESPADTCGFDCYVRRHFEDRRSQLRQPVASVLDENERLKRRTERQTAIIRLLVVLLKLSGFRFDEQRLPDGTAKAKVLHAIDRCKDALPLKSAVRLVGLSPARYHAWKRAKNGASSMTDRAARALIQPNSPPPR